MLNKTSAGTLPMIDLEESEAEDDWMDHGDWRLERRKERSSKGSERRRWR